MNERHALVLGASGFLGEAVIRQLNGWRLTILVHRRVPQGLPKDTRVLRGQLGGVTLKEKPDVVLHCARLRGPGKWGRYLAACRGNVANRRILRRLSGTPLVYASGSLMYGDCGEQPVLEDSPLRPVSYARQYAIAERPLLRADVMMFRPGWILGPGSWLEWFYLQPAERLGVVPVYGAGKNLMSIVHRDDCAAAMIRVASHNQTGVYHPPSLPVMTQREFVEQLAAELGLPVQEKCLDRSETAIQEAFQVSLNLQSRHTELWRNFVPRFRDLRAALKAVLAERTARTRQSASRE